MYIGRFAPTPSGPLHFGSIITALASYLDAKQNNGQWKVRIDDIDSPRIVEGADSLILKNLESLGLFWDDKISRQSENIQEYKNILEMLKSKNLTYNCNCSRKKIALSNQSDLNEPIYNNHCRSMQHPLSNKSAIRLIADYKSIQFIDRTQGPQFTDINNSVGDFIIKRSDQLYAYQLAVVIDDQLQSVTNIVRGTDLLNSTIKQYYINNLLNFPDKTYMHIPIATINNRKLSKGNGDKLNNSNFSLILIEGLKFLRQKIKKDFKEANPREILKYAVENWDSTPLQKIKNIELNSSLRVIVDNAHT